MVPISSTCSVSNPSISPAPSLTYDFVPGAWGQRCTIDSWFDLVSQWLDPPQSPARARRHVCSGLRAAWYQALLGEDIQALQASALFRFLRHWLQSAPPWRLFQGPLLGSVPPRATPTISWGFPQPGAPGRGRLASRPPVPSSSLLPSPGGSP